MKLINKLVNKSKLFTKIICIGVLFSFYVNSATVNVAPGVGRNPGVYAYNNAVGGFGNRWNNGATLLTAATLRQYLFNIAAGAVPGIANQDCIKELARMLLAQISAPGGGIGPHNVPNNNVPAYTIARKSAGAGCNFMDIHLTYGGTDLQEHLLRHGHLGHFPNIPGILGKPAGINNPNNRVNFSNNAKPRGIFNILTTVTNRINSSILNVGWAANDWNFRFDPHVRNNLSGPTLETIAKDLIDNLLSGNHVTNVIISALQNGQYGDNTRFTLDVTYNFPNCIPGVTETRDIGYKRDNTITNTVRIVVDVLFGKIKIVTMYPY